MADEYESTLYEDKFVETVAKALRIIRSGMKQGADNIELMLTRREIHYLGPMLDIINRGEIEQKQGNENKLVALDSMLSDYGLGSKDELRNVFKKCQELERIQGSYMNADDWLTRLTEGKSYCADSDPFSEDENLYAKCVLTSDYERDQVPPSTTKAKKFLPNNEIFRLNKNLEEKIHDFGIGVREEYRQDIAKLRQASADKYAYSRNELLGTLESYNSAYK